MRNIYLVLILGLLFNGTVLAQSDCFLAKEKEQVLLQEGVCDIQYPPRCSFNFALSLMGFDSGILIDELNPEQPFIGDPQGVAERWVQSHYPKKWISNSCFWYSQFITEELGMRSFRKYVEQFNYGNKNLSGDAGERNGLMRSWINGSLKVSAEEQTEFLQKIIDEQLGVTEYAYAMTKAIFRLDDLATWKLYGKTGTGNLRNSDGTVNNDKQGGWFVGWIEKDDRAIVFAQYTECEFAGEYIAGRRAKEAAIEKLTAIIAGFGQ